MRNILMRNILKNIMEPDFGKWAIKMAKKMVSIFLICMFLLPDSGYALRQKPLKSEKAASLFTYLSTWDVSEREAAKKMRAAAYRKLFEEKLAPRGGGKIAFDMILEKLAKKIGFKTIRSIRLMIADAWGRFCDDKDNQYLIKEGNTLIEKDLKENGKVSQETIDRLREIIELELRFPLYLEELIDFKTGGLKGEIIDRSSQRDEDSYERNLAGALISLRKSERILAAAGLRSIFKNFIETVWIEQNKPGGKKIEGLPNVLSKERGMGVLIQRFISFDASGAAKSDLYGYTRIHAAVGDPEAVVKSMYANSAQFLFKNGQNPQTAEYEYDPTFLTMPHTVKLKGRTLKADEEPEALRNLLDLDSGIGLKYARIKGKFSPISEKEARELYRVISEISEEIGVPLDVEWGFLDGELYIHQIRPIIGDFSRPLVEKDESLVKLKPISSTPGALGHTNSKGFTGPVVLLGRDLTSEETKVLEKWLGEDYIRIQSDVSGSVYQYGSERAKVLVDPYVGEADNAHCIDSLTGRIGKGEFYYACGPVLQDGLCRNLEFVPHPDMRGVWISKERVTYFCDGLRASFYPAGEKEKREGTLEPGLREKRLREFHDVVKEMWLEKGDFVIKKDKNSEFFNVNEFARFLIVNTLCGNDVAEDEGIVLREALYNPDKNDIMKEIEAQFNRLDALKILKDMQPKIALLSEALSNPLYPKPWESELMRVMKRVLLLEGMDEYFEGKEKPEGAYREREYVKTPEGAPKGEPKTPRLKVLFLDDDAPTRENLKIMWESNLNPRDYELVCVGKQEEATEMLKSGNFGMVIFDWRIPGGLGTDFFEEVLKVPSAVIFSFTTYPEMKEWLSKEICAHCGYADKLRKEELFDRVRAAREKQVVDWEIEHGRRFPVTKVLAVDDEKAILEDYEDGLSLSRDEYSLYTATSWKDALAVFGEHEIDAVVYDIAIPEERGKEAFFIRLRGIKSIICCSGRSAQMMKETTALFVDTGTLSRIDFLEKPFSLRLELAPKLKEAREKQLDEWTAKNPEKAARLHRVRQITKPAVFVIDNNGNRAETLARRLQEFFDAGRYEYDVIAIDSMSELRDELKIRVPHTVITDVELKKEGEEGNDNLETILAEVKKKNNDVRIIIASEEARLASQEGLKGYNIEGVVEKPFYVKDVIDTLHYIYSEEKEAAGARFRIEEAARIAAKIKITQKTGSAATIRLWEGYDEPMPISAGMLQRIKQKTKNSPYEIAFETDIDRLVELAVAEAENEDSVTILPDGILTEAQRNKLTEAKAQVIFMDIEKEPSAKYEREGLVQIGAMIFAGVAYLNNDDTRLMELYRLITGDFDHELISISQLKANPGLLRFMFKPIKVSNISKFDRLLRLMEETILSAA